MFQEQNAVYLVGAYIVFLGGLLAYFVSLKWRQRNLSRDEATLNQIAAEMDAERKENASVGSPVSQSSDASLNAAQTRP